MRTRKVCGSVRAGRKHSQNEWYKDEIKGGAYLKEASWKNVLGADDNIMKEKNKNKINTKI